MFSQVSIEFLRFPLLVFTNSNSYLLFLVSRKLFKAEVPNDYLCMHFCSQFLFIYLFIFVVFLKTLEIINIKGVLVSMWAHRLMGKLHLGDNSNP
jgi:hypothetical protein